VATQRVPWRESPWVPGVRYVRLRATSPTYGAVTIVIVHEPVCRTVRPVSLVTLPRRVGRGDALRRKWCCNTTCGTSCLDLCTFRVQNEQRSASDQDG